MIIMGPPGAGKGTQAMRIAAAYGIPHISTGDIFRKHIENETPLGLEVKRSLDRGQLAPDKVACAIVSERLQESDCQNGYILDGFPRSRPQAECLQQLLKTRKEALDLVVSIEVADDDLVERLSARRTCPKCGRIYNLRFEPPRAPGHCDNEECGGAELLQRSDDQETTIRERLRVYHLESEPIIGYYRAAGLLRAVPGGGVTPDGVFAKIEEIINATDLAPVS